MNILIENLTNEKLSNQGNFVFLEYLFENFLFLFNNSELKIKILLVNNEYLNKNYISPHQFNNMSFCNIFTEIDGDYIFPENNEIFINIDFVNKLNNKLFSAAEIASKFIFTTCFIYESNFNTPIQLYDMSGDINDILKIINRINFKYGNFSIFKEYGFKIASSILNKNLLINNQLMIT